jgi:hypothetical protein
LNCAVRVSALSTLAMFACAVPGSPQADQAPCTTGRPALFPERRMLCSQRDRQGLLKVFVLTEARAPQADAIVSFISPRRGTVLWSMTTAKDGSVSVRVRTSEEGFLVVGAKDWASQSFPQALTAACATEIRVILSREEWVPTVDAMDRGCLVAPPNGKIQHSNKRWTAYLEERLDARRRTTRCS